MQILVVDATPSTLPEGTISLLRGYGSTITTANDYPQAMEIARIGSIDAALLTGPRDEQHDGSRRCDFRNLLQIIDTQRIAAIVLDDAPAAYQPASKSLVEIVDRNVSLDELRGRFAMIERYHHHFSRMENELRNMERLGKRLNEHFREVDQEMRLAASLQRDFLPRINKPIGNVRFEAIFRPASWVSGDIFDVVRIDEEHTGFYVADAVGHGLAASLLTMFIKRSITTKRVEGDRYVILDPSEVMQNLNRSLTEQSLPNCQFVTACYGIINHRTLSFRYARGGHPYPLLITSDGPSHELKTHGALLGLFEEEEFPTFETQLRTGDKLVLYTDGVELEFHGDDGEALDISAFRRCVESFARQPIQELIHQLESQLDDKDGSINPKDDVTIVGLEILDT